MSHVIRVGHVIKVRGAPRKKESTPGLWKCAVCDKGVTGAEVG